MNFENILKEYSSKIRYFNYSNRTNEIYTHISTKKLSEIPLPI